MEQKYLKEEEIAQYLPYRPWVQYTGILNGSELKAYEKSFNDEYGHDFFASNSDNYQPPKAVEGEKLGYIKIANYFKDYVSYRIGVRTGGLKTFYGGYNFKLVLRPMEDMYKTIKVKKDEVIPIIAIAKKEYPDVEFSIIDGKCIGRLNAGITIWFDIEGEIPFIKEIHNNMFGRVSNNDYDDMYLANMTPSQLRRELLSYHFDVDNLIEKELAVNYNDVIVK